MKTLNFTGIISSITSKVDRSLSVRLVTPELSTEERAEFMNYQNINSQITLEPLDEPSEEKMDIQTDLETKTPSQRLRGVIYVYYSQKGIKEDFDTFYRNQMEKIIDKIKSYLD